LKKDEIDFKFEMDPKSRFKRIISLDIYRGWAIVFVVMFHGIVFNAFENTGKAQQNIDIWLFLVLIPFVILGTWASLFCFITGIGTTYAINSRLIENEDYSLKKRYFKSLLRVLILLFLHFMWCYFFAPQDENVLGQTHISMISGSIRTGNLSFPSPLIFFRTSAFSMLAFTELLLSTTLVILFRNGGYKKTRRNKFIFLLIGSLILIPGEILSLVFKPIIFHNLTAEDSMLHYILALLDIWLFNGSRAAFPDAGFAFFGAYLGLLKAKKSSPEKIMLKGATKGWIMVFLGAFLMLFFGIPLISTQRLYPVGLYVFNLGIQMILGAWLLCQDFIPMDQRRLERPILQWSVNPRRWGLISLTLFLLEQPYSALVCACFKFLFSSLMKDLFFVVFVFAPTYYFITVRFLCLWENYNFKYSLEWLLASIGKDRDVSQNEDFLHINDIVYLPSFKIRNPETGEVRNLTNDENLNKDIPFETSKEYKKVSVFHLKEMKNLMDM